MGDGVDFLHPEGADRRDLVAKLSGISGLDDPELLARLLDGMAGNDLEFWAFESDAEIRKIRKVVRPRLEKALTAAKRVLEVRSDAGHLDTFQPAVKGCLREPDKRGTERAAQLVHALEQLASVDLSEGLGTGGRPRKDESVQRVVDAVATYCARKGIRFSGAPRRDQLADGPAHVASSKAAKLTEAVLDALGLGVSNRQLATFMTRAVPAKSAN